MRTRSWPSVLALAVIGSGGCGADDSMRTDWWLSTSPTGTRLEVVVYTNGSSCTDFEEVDVVERDDEVVVHAFVQHRDGDCTSDYSVEPVVVELDAPLGARRLVGCAAPDDGLRAPDRRVDPLRCAQPIPG